MLVTPRTHGCGKVFDANGLEWKYMLWVNTETGEGEQAVVGANGQKQLNSSKKELLTQIVKLPAPVLFMPIVSSEPTATHNGGYAPVCPKCHHAGKEI